MEYIALGKSNLLVSRIAFSAMSIRNMDDEEQAAILVHQAYDAGINFFDTAHFTPESERRLGACLHGIRQDVIIATKSAAVTGQKLSLELEKSLDALQSDYVDLFLYKTDSLQSVSDDSDGIRNSLETLRSAGKIRHIGLSTETLTVARQSATDSLYEVVQYPFNVLTEESVYDLVRLCQEQDIGFIAQRPLYGGLIQDIALAFGFLHQYENVVPVWGVRTIDELKQLLYFEAHPPVVDASFKDKIKHLRTFFS